MEVYKVKFVKNFDYFGETDFGSKTIRIKEGMSKRETLNTFIHEVLHVFEMELDMPMKHKKVYALEKAIANFIIDNFF